MVRQLNVSYKRVQDKTQSKKGRPLLNIRGGKAKILKDSCMGVERDTENDHPSLSISIRQINLLKTMTIN